MSAHTWLHKPPAMTWREHLAGQAAASLMVGAGRLAEKRGDIHELRHYAAALAAGNTGPSHDDAPCLAALVLDRATLISPRPSIEPWRQRMKRKRANEMGATDA